MAVGVTTNERIERNAERMHDQWKSKRERIPLQDFTTTYILCEKIEYVEEIRGCEYLKVMTPDVTRNMICTILDMKAKIKEV